MTFNNSLEVNSELLTGLFSSLRKNEKTSARRKKLFEIF
jgi:hypothetical protein